MIFWLAVKRYAGDRVLSILCSATAASAEANVSLPKSSSRDMFNSCDIFYFTM